MFTISKYIKKAFYTLCLISVVYTSGYAEKMESNNQKIISAPALDSKNANATVSNEEIAKETVTNLVTKIQAIVTTNGKQEEYKPILLKYLDFNEISRRVLDGVRKDMRRNQKKNAQVAQKEIEEFLPKFIPVFTDYMIKKYSKPEITEKFKNMDFIMNRSNSNGKYYSINTTFKPHNSSTADVKVEWKTLNGKVVDMIFSDASASFFKNETSEATAKYKQAGNNLDDLLTQYN
ncbi:MAG: ABC transporter substrate-binding protein [Candidatus Paracaedibacteraceae bacterium]|nr:ABC transporter substrate-binding protein [Candidatus Paracaedibacteraceae bacterium]